MKDYKKSAELTLAVTYILMIVLAVFVVALPFATTWYVEKKARPAELATVTMLSCYPCVPFAVLALFSLKSLLKNIIKGNINDDKNYTHLKSVSVCCLVAGFIMLIAGFFYKPFFISSGSALFCSLVVKVIMDIFLSVKKDN